MTHPLTPREKVRKVIIDVMKPKDADITLGRIDTCTDAILTALASGSGDHAELASLMRLTKRLRGIAFDYIGKADRTTCIETEAANALEFLLAENAALRADLAKTGRDFSELRDSYDAVSNKLCVERAHGGRETKRATEAERKLAEAKQVIREISETAQITRVRHLASTFLSKEAERG